MTILPMEPASLFVPFTAYRLSRAYVAMANDLFAPQSEQELLEAYRYIVPAAATAPDTVQATHKQFLAERYNTFGYHGGGVRVGTDGAFQIKGIGCTPLLASRRVDFAYSNGQKPLGEAIRELIWGEVLHAALPYGATRCPLVIGTGTNCVLNKNDRSEAKIARGLLVREFALRPAHFTRAVYYKPRKGVCIAPDSVRVRDAIARLPDLLPMPGNWNCDDWRALSGTERLLQGLAEMSLRFARQLAVARARRIMHGAITSSNLCLDGRWIDFDSLSRPPVHGSCRHIDPPFWYDHEKIIETLNALWFFVCKYMPGGAQTLPDMHTLVELFQRDLTRELKWAFLELTGIPVPLLQQLPCHERDTALTLSTLIIDLARSGTLKASSGEAEELLTHGTYDVGRIMIRLAVHREAQDCDAHLRELIVDERRRFKLIDLYRRTAAAAALTARLDGWDPANLRKVTALNAIKFSTHIPLLNGRGLMEEITSSVLAQADVAELRVRAEDLFHRVMTDVGLIYGPGQTGRVAMDRIDSRSVFYDATDDVWIIEGAQSFRTVFRWAAARPEDSSPPPELLHLGARWGNRVRELAHV